MLFPILNNLALWISDLHWLGSCFCVYGFYLLVRTNWTSCPYASIEWNLDCTKLITDSNNNEEGIVQTFSFIWVGYSTFLNKEMQNLPFFFFDKEGEELIYFQCTLPDTLRDRFNFEMHILFTYTWTWWKLVQPCAMTWTQKGDGSFEGYSVRQPSARCRSV